MIIFFFLFFTLFSFQQTEGASLLKEGIKESMRFGRGFKYAHRGFKNVDETAWMSQSSGFLVSRSTYRHEEGFPSSPLALLALGAYGVSFLLNDTVKCDGRDEEFERMLVEGYARLKELEQKTKGKQIVFLMGPTGEGKSLIAKHLTTGKTIEKIKEEEKQKGSKPSVSQTLYPEVLCWGDFCFCDPPGFEDRGRSENHKLLTSIMLRSVLKTGADKDIRLALVINPNRFESDRGRALHRTFSEEFFPLLHGNVFSSNGVLCIFNDVRGRKETRDYVAELRDLEEAAKGILHNARHSHFSPRNSETQIKTVQENEFYLEGLRKISVSFIDFNNATREEIFERLQELRPFSLNLKPFGGDLGRLIAVWDKGEALRRDIAHLKEEIAFIELENHELECILGLPTYPANKKGLVEERKRLAMRYRSLAEEKEKFSKGHKVLRSAGEGRKLTWGLFLSILPIPKSLKYTEATFENPDKKPFSLPVIVWVNGKSWQLAPDTKPADIPSGFTTRTIRPEDGVLKLVYKGAFGSDDDVWVQLAMADAEPGALLMRSKKLEATSEDFNFTERLIKRNDEFVELVKSQERDKLENKRKDNSQKIKELAEEMRRLESQFLKQKDVFEATVGLVDRLFNGSELRRSFEKTK